MDTNRRNFIGSGLALAAVAGCTAPRCGGNAAKTPPAPRNFSISGNCTLRKVSRVQKAKAPILVQLLPGSNTTAVRLHPVELNK